MLFDIGIAGPLAGFVFAVPALFIGIAMSPVVRFPIRPSAQRDDHELGEPLLFQAATWLTWGSIPDGYTLNLHPMAFAAWFGLLATALNLFPIGQLDGGHISYAVLGRRSTTVTLASICVAIGLTFFSMSWLVWTFLLVAMTLAMGPRHPRTIDEDIPLDSHAHLDGRSGAGDFRPLLHAESRSSRPNCSAADTFRVNPRGARLW